jgi:hypothetical protein
VNRTPLKVLAVLMGLLAISNFMKPISQMMAPESSAGFVFFGHRLHGTANAIMGPLFGVLLAAYAYGAWNAKRWVVGLAGAYAVYVIVNLVLFTTLEATEEEKAKVLFNLVYLVVAVGVSGGGALHLWRNRDRLA